MRAALVLVALAGCLEPSVTTCDDLLCAPGQVCSVRGCVLQEQLDACATLADGDACAYPGVNSARCVDGVCESFACGNDVTEEDQGEVCDDGNTVSGDGCRGDCQKLEVCGDTLVDDGEACDDGNANVADGCAGCQETTWEATAIVGGNLQATDVALGNLEAVAADEHGNLYVCDSTHHVIRRIDRSGVITTVAGTSVAGFSGDGGVATSAALDTPAGIAIDGLGNVYVSDTGNHRVRKIDAATGVITTFAGGGSGALGDGGPAIGATLVYPGGLAVDGLGNVFVADALNFRVRRIDLDGIITTVVSDVGLPAGLAVDDDGALYLGVVNLDVVRRIDPGGAVTTIAGTGTAGYSGDGGPATSAQLYEPAHLVVRGRALYIADANNHVIRRVDLDTGIISTFAGVGELSGDAGDGGPATSARFQSPGGVAALRDGTVAIADTQNRRVRVVDAAGTIATVAGSGADVVLGDGKLATGAALSGPRAIEVAGDGALYIADTGRDAIRRVDPVTGVITTAVGPDAGLSSPRGLAFDDAGNLFIADTFNGLVRRVDAGTGAITAVASGLAQPTALVADAGGHVFVADTYDHRVLRIDAGTGAVTTVAGDGIEATTGDGGLAVDAQLAYPTGLAIDADGRLLILEYAGRCVRRVELDDTIDTIVDESALGSPTDLAIDASGALYIADQGSHTVGRVDPITGELTAVIGDGAVGSYGDGGPGAEAALSPEALAIDAAGRIVTTHGTTSRIRRWDPTTDVITTIAGQIDPAGVGLAPEARLFDPRAIVPWPGGALVAGGASGTVQVATADRVAIVAGRYPHEVATADLARYRADSFGPIGGVAHDATAGAIYATETTAGTVQAITLVDPDDSTTWTIAPLVTGLRAPTGLYLDDAARILYVADAGAHAIRAIDLDGGPVTTLAGVVDQLGFHGDGGLATSALLYQPEAVTRCGDSFFVADTGNHRVRRIDPAGVITTVLGDGVAASSGQGAPASTFPVDHPRGLACDLTGNLYVTSGSTVRQVAADDLGDVDGTGPVVSILSRDTFPGSVTHCLTGLRVVDDTTLHVVDSCTGMLIELLLSSP